MTFEVLQDQIEHIDMILISTRISLISNRTY